jgi:hypothetical protein
MNQRSTTHEAARIANVSPTSVWSVSKHLLYILINESTHQKGVSSAIQLYNPLHIVGQGVVPAYGKHFASQIRFFSATSIVIRV